MNKNSTKRGLKFEKNIFFYVIAAFISIAIAACADTEPEPIIVEHYIDNRLRPYFNAFKEEAATRGMDIDFRLLKVDGYIQSIPEQGVAGQCQTNTNNTTAVVVQPLYWDNINEFDKEFLIFHELGHCVLKREHLDEANPDGTCVSIMNSGGIFCDINYNSRTRDQYIDELFF